MSPSKHRVAAARLAGVNSTMVSKWVRTGVIPERGRGPRNAVLVSRADVLAAVRWLGDRIWLLGPPRLRPRSQWEGPLPEALRRLATLPDDAGPEAFWAAFR